MLAQELELISFLFPHLSLQYCIEVFARNLQNLTWSLADDGPIPWHILQKRDLPEKGASPQGSDMGTLRPRIAFVLRLYRTLLIVLICVRIAFAFDFGFVFSVGVCCNCRRNCHLYLRR
jgi:hypothetical protein